MDNTINIERYDRQVRLWGNHGQNKCSNSKICLINADSLGIEILKGLCLAGIGSFAILDSHKVTYDDIGCSILPHSCLGKNRAESAKNALLELNGDVKGEDYPLEVYLPHAINNSQNLDTSIEIEYNHIFWKQFNCVIASGFLHIDQITRLSKICWQISCPLIFCKSIGFYGSFRSQIKEHLVVETHPDNVLPDFGLDKPFPDLEDYFDSINLEDDEALDKINSYPYVVIVYKYLKKWQKLGGLPQDRVPISHSEKKALKDLINEGLKDLTKKRQTRSVNNQESMIEQVLPFENFMEAIKAINSCFAITRVYLEDESPIKAIFNHPHVTESATQSRSKFWLIIKALKEFILTKNGGRLPISGTIPDMTSSSQEYIKLQAVYSKRAKEDVDAVFSRVQNMASSNTTSINGTLYEETKLICKHIRNLQLINSEPIYEDYVSKTRCFKLDEEEDELFAIGLCLMAVDLFLSTFGRLPGCQDIQVETDISKLKDCVKLIFGKNSNRLKYMDQCLYEVCRYGGAELHATSAFMGGCIAQEVIKVITNQYVPVDNTLVYSALSAMTKAFKLNDMVIGNVES